MRSAAIEKWYARQCNGEWEHSYGIKIDTLDNPGWTVQIDLSETRKQDSVFKRVEIERTKDDWIQYWVEKRVSNRVWPTELE
ncbi:MAG TPA: Imm53 family immunity protein [Candidatus Angelobacter sp.]|nr:Imm53 family immunity protein [Candidatus Angelobacter sp.]